MSHPGLLRVTVTSSTRRVDLALPAAVPVAELVPELARSVGVLEAATAHCGYQLVERDGRILDPVSGLAAQGVEDGGVLTVVTGVVDEAPTIHDDLAVALAEVVTYDVRPWDAATGRRTALAAALFLLLAAAAALVLSPGSAVSPTAPVATSVALVVGAVLASRLRARAEAALTLGYTGCAYAAVSGLVLVRGSPPSAMTYAAAGVGCLAAALVLALGLTSGGALMLPPGVAGAVFVVTGLGAARTSFAPPSVLTVAVTIVVLGGTTIPWLALATAGAGGAHVWPGDGSVVTPIDLERLRADARVAHEIAVGLSATTGLLLVVVAPFAVSCGPAGAVVISLCCVLVMLRTRGRRGRTDVAVGLGSGVLGLASTAASALLLEASWRPGAHVALATAGLLLLAVTQGSRPRSVRLARLGDLAETATVLLLPPALVVATGLFAAVGG